MSDHREAFCLMSYACRCGHRERIWNSRDGVTPFGCRCPSCGDASLMHVDWKQDESAPNHKLIKGQHFWRDGTPDEAEAIMRRRIEQAKGGRWEASPEMEIELIRQARDDTDGEFRKGWPTLDVYAGPALVAVASGEGKV